jgi:hypothetical protein
MARARRAGQGVPAMHKGPTVAPLFEVHTVVLLPSVRMAEPHIARQLTVDLSTAVRSMAARSIGRGSRHPIMVPLSRAWHLAA